MSRPACRVASDPANPTVKKNTRNDMLFPATEFDLRVPANDAMKKDSIR